MNDMVFSVRRLAVLSLLLAVLFLCSAYIPLHSCPSKLWLEVDYMGPLLKPELHSLGTVLGECNWEVTRYDDEDVEFHYRLEELKYPLQWVLGHNNTSLPSGFNGKAYIMGVSKYLHYNGLWFMGEESGRAGAIVCLVTCAEKHPEQADYTSNHEIGHYWIDAHCTTPDPCVMKQPYTVNNFCDAHKLQIRNTTPRGWPY